MSDEARDQALSRQVDNLAYVNISLANLPALEGHPHIETQSSCHDMSIGGSIHGLWSLFMRYIQWEKKAILTRNTAKGGKDRYYVFLNNKIRYPSNTMSR